MEKLARIAFQNTEVKRMKAESCYQIGRMKHFQGDTQTALSYYEYAVKAWPEFPLAQYGLGQMFLLMDRIPEAIACFERALKQDPTNAEILKVLASLCANLNDLSKSIEYFRKLNESHKKKIKEPEVPSLYCIYPPSPPNDYLRFGLKLHN